MPNCPSCSLPVDTDSKFCIYCNAPIEPANAQSRTVAVAPTLVTTPGVCPNCAASIDDDAKFCPSCRTPVTFTGPINCPGCGKLVNAEAKFCKYCAADLTSPTQPTQSSQEQPVSAEGFVPSPQSSLRQQTSAGLQSASLSQEFQNESSTGLASNVAALLVCLVVLISGIIVSYIVGLIVPGLIDSSLTPQNLAYLISQNSGYIPSRLVPSLIASGIVCAIIGAGITCGIGLIAFLVEKKSALVRFYAMQSILLCVLWFVASTIGSIIVSMMLAGDFGYNMFTGGTKPEPGDVTPLIGVGISLLIPAVFLVLWVLLMVKAYKGRMFKLPLVGSMAGKIVKVNPD